MKNLFSLCLVLLILFSAGYSREVSPPKFSLKGGFYKSPRVVYLTPENPADSICYTTDGSEPTIKSGRYNSPLTIEKTTVLKARAFLSDSVYSKVVTNTYFINENTVLPVFSISTDPKNLWDSDSGIYVYPNYNNDWERPIHLEFFESDGSPAFSMDAGIKINGEGSRQFPQKSLAILARAGYGYGKIKYKIFPDMPVDEFEVLLLRNAGGTEWNNTAFRDGLMHTLLRNTNVDVLAYRPCIVFLNGEYFGIHNIGEKSDEHYIESHHNIDADSVYIMRYWGIQPERGGSACQSSYFPAQGFAGTADLTSQQNYDSLKKLLELDEFTGYLVSQSFYANTDWPDNNVKCWRGARPGGRWRWILWDTDEGFDFHNNETYKLMSLDCLTGDKNPLMTVPQHVAKIISNLLTNESFKNNFINCFADFTNTFLRKDSLLKTIGAFKKRIEPEIPRHFRRWNADPAKWYDNLIILERFAENRQSYIQQNFMTKFKLKGTAAVNLNVNDVHSGNIKLNSIDISGFPWTGNYFTGIPVTITARANPGFKFREWQGVNDKKSNPLTLSPEQDIYVTALLEPDSSFSNIVINEINYNSSPGFDTEDWIELFNASTSDRDLSGWTLKDEDEMHSFLIPGKTILRSGEYLVLCRDTMKFTSLFPEIKNRTGNFDFGLNNAGELIRLFDSSSNLIDSLTFNDKAPWPTEADGSGKTLELKNPLLDNSEPLNWSASFDHGSPGRKNSWYTAVGTTRSEIQKKYCLLQNYPNPFNPATTISYSISKQSFVKLRVFDMLGRGVSTLVSKEQRAGEYKVQFDGSILPSGIYIYSIQAGEFRDSKKLMLVK